MNLVSRRISIHRLTSTSSRRWQDRYSSKFVGGPLMFLVVPKLNELSHFDLNLLTRSRRSALGPLDRFFDRLHLDKPVARDQFLRLRKRPIDDGLLSVGRNIDPRARRTRIQARRINQNSRCRLLLVVFHHRIDRFLARHLAGFGVLRRFQDQHEFHFHLSRLSLVGRWNFNWPHSYIESAIQKSTCRRKYFRLGHFFCFCISFESSMCLLSPSLGAKSSISKNRRTSISVSCPGCGDGARFAHSSASSGDFT